MLARYAKVTALAIGFLLGSTAILPTGAFGQSSARTAAPTVYQQIGGYDFLARFVDTAFPRVAGNDQLARLFRGHSRDSQMRQRQLIIDALCGAAGGPCVYIGRDMRSVHDGLGITSSDWDVFIGIIASTLHEFGLTESAEHAFLGLFDDIRPRVVDEGHQPRLR